MIALGDKSQYTRVIQNLIDNAVKFAEDAGELEVKIIEKKPKILISVRNSGPYIIKEELDEVWRRFSKLDSSRGKIKTSSGLGLSIVKEIIKAHDEEVFVYSSEDIGVEFSFTMTKKR
jgi:signal transduction histidine kinase